MRSLPKFSVENPVLVGVMMAALLIGGVYASFTLVREMFPESRPNQISISVPYPGATPLEIESGLALRIEEAIEGLEQIDKVVTKISEGLCVIQVEMSSEVDDMDQAVNDFKAAIDAVPRDELPEEAEEIRVAWSEPKLPVISVTIHGEIDERSRKALGEQLREDLLRIPDISDIQIGGTRKSELTVEVIPEKLIAYKASLTQIASAIGQANLDLPGGQLKTTDQNVAVRTLGETDDVERIADTIIRTTSAGQIVRVRDLGTVVDGFEDSDLSGRFNGHPAVSATVYKTGRQDAIDIAQKVRAFVAGKRHQPMEWDWFTRLKGALGIETAAQRVYAQAWADPYPANLTIVTHSNLARFIEGRLELLQRNGVWGLSLVFISLLLFLNWRVAFWVMGGLFLSVCGAVILMSLIGASLNLISMFGLIVVLGLIVDDAIVIGENIYARVERGEDPRTAAVEGAREVTWPVVVAVCTTIGAFLPLLFVEGRIGDFMGVLPVVVICALSVSLLEALSILPCHLAEWLKPVRRELNGAPPRNFVARLAKPFRQAEQHFILGVLGRHYERLLRLATRYRYVTVATAVALFLVAAGVVAGERVPFVFLQKMDAETLMADLDMPVGTPAARTKEAMTVVEQAALAIPDVNSVWAIVGAQLDADEGGAYRTARSHLAQVILELKTVEHRDRSSDDIINELRVRTAEIPGVNALRYRSMQGGPAGPEIAIEITGEDTEPLLEAADVIKQKLRTYAGVFDIADDFERGRRELQIELLDSARPLGLTTRGLATEIRGAFYGLEARTIQRGREDVDIRVRFPESRRRSVYELESMRIATPAGEMVPFCEVARLVETRGAAAVRRVNQRRAIDVSADVDQNVTNAEQVLANLAGTVANLQHQYPGIRIGYSGNREQTRKSFGSLRRDFLIAVILIYFMLAGLFKSYVQPLIVLTAVPFGLNGAVVGHYVMGYPLTILSMIGLVALTGIVVNDALILVSFVNKEVEAGTPKSEAVISGGLRRLRPILLTSLTTILGLAPLMAETSFQARFLIPLAISISFGLAFATLLTLVVVPANYLIVEDIKAVFRRIWYGPRPQSEVAWT